MRQSRLLRVLKSITAVSIVLLLVTSCGGQSAKQQANQPKAKEQFVALVRHHPQTLDPHIGTDNPTRKFLIAAYEPLIRVKPGGKELEPFLAESWEVSGDAKSYTFRLRKGVKFHDGSEMDAAAVKASFERMKKIGLGNAWALKDVAKIDTPDEYTVVITLNKTDASFLAAIPLVNIVSPKAVQEHAKGDDLAQDWLKEHEAGTGPYYLREWTMGERMVLEKFPDYWRGWDGKHFAELVLRRVEEAATQRVMMEAGEGDWADTIDVDDLDPMEKSGQFTIISEPGPTLFYIMMNTNKAPLDNPKVRRAIRYAFDYETMVKEIMKGRAEVPRGYLPPAFAEHDGGAPEQYDLDKAKQLLAEAGYPNGGFTLDLMYFDPLAWERMGSELLADRLSKLGITLKLEGLPWASMMTKFADPSLRPHMAFYSATPTTSSPDSCFGQTFWSQSKHWSQYGYHNAEVDRLIEQARQTLDDAQRTAIYQQIQQILRDDSPGIPAVLSYTTHVFRANVKGFKLLTFMPDMIDYYGLYRE